MAPVVRRNQHGRFRRAKLLIYIAIRYHYHLLSAEKLALLAKRKSGVDNCKTGTPPRQVYWEIYGHEG
jgi:hypothetical protein